MTEVAVLNDGRGVFQTISVNADFLYGLSVYTDPSGTDFQSNLYIPT